MLLLLMMKPTIADNVERRRLPCFKHSWTKVTSFLTLAMITMAMLMLLIIWDNKKVIWDDKITISDNEKIIWDNKKWPQGSLNLRAACWFLAVKCFCFDSCRIWTQGSTWFKDHKDHKDHKDLLDSRIARIISPTFCPKMTPAGLSHRQAGPPPWLGPGIGTHTSAGKKDIFLLLYNVHVIIVIQDALGYTV